MAYFQKVPAKNKQGYKWKCTEDAPRDPVTGERRQITRRGDTKKEASEKVQLALKELEQNNYLSLDNKVTFKDFLPDWLDTYKKGKVKPSTYESHKRNISTHLLANFGHLKVRDLTVHRYQKYINTLLETRKTATVQHINATMSNALKKAAELGIITKNPCVGVIIKKRNEIVEEKIQYWVKEDIKLFLKCCKQDKETYFFLFLTLIRTGLRKGEAMALQWEDIDLDKAELNVNKTLLYHLSSEEDAFGPPKTNSSYRTIKLDPYLIQELRKLKHLQNKRKLLYGDRYSKLNFVFCKEDGKRLRDRTIQTAFERLKRVSRLPNIKIHDLRHTHAVMLLEAEVSLKEIQERLGHKDIMTTGNIYSHVTKSMEAKSINKFSEYMADSNTF
ncbi:tyrosine-type recombinase/integrase [Metabacillus idriensis]|uniref:tyrosine-type recombinase/integrase n=1 Tax=Metabacillus idriensis TaxID=324768 RepID=UPI0012AF98B2|nr:site-specific integrase [Metabacillus idriensis]